ncbi:MAG: amidase [Candidatus Rokubacteria bacterium]|nr:amidase [Candidatus Rokubacteria bacterium]
MHEDISFLTIRDLARRIRGRDISPVEVVRAYLERIEALNPRLNAIVTLNPEALAEAGRAEDRVVHGEPLGPLHGVPFTVKDCFDTAGVRTTRGSRLFTDYVPAADATAVARLKRAGGVFLAKTNLPEFAFWWETDNLVFGRTVNPWNPARTAGGSSGGEAVALATGLSPLGLGSDVGGSIRMPAHCCGVVGLKATHGRIPLTGHWPETLLRAMHVGPMARAVGDLALALQILAGPDGHDPYALPVPAPELPDPGPSLRGLRVGWSAEGGAAPVEPVIRQVVSDAAACFAGLGCHVEPVSIPALDQRDWQVLSATLYAAEAGAYLEPIIAGRRGELHPVLQRRLGVGSGSLGDYLRAHAEWEQLRREVAAYFSRYDLFLCPCVPVVAYPHGQVELTINGKVVPARHALRATVPWDLTGSPALAVPFGWSPDELPVAVQLVGRHFDEATVLRAGAALEAVRPVARRPPVT